MTSQDTSEAIRSLVQTITKDDPQTKLSSDAITRLTEKLGEIVGFDPSADFTPRRNERGELVNEEGLPIIDITEPEGGANTDGFIPPPEPIFRFQDIPAHTRNRLRQHRDSILDQLEQEEREEEERERQKEREEVAEQARKRAAAATHHKNAKELQKKMGKALLKSIAESKDKAEKAKEEQRIKDEEEAAKRKASSTKERKSVKFAEPDSEDEGERKEDWGDVVPGKIKPMKRPNLLSQSTTKETMKMNVVERRPARPVSPPRPTVPDKDSDDESDVAPPSDDELQSDNELEEEADFDFANLQRQVQLEYYRKRATIGQDAASLIQTASEPKPTTEDTLGITKGDSSKPAISQYRASRLLSAYGTSNPASASNFVVPGNSAKTMQNAIRTGKLDDDGKLVGGEDDSASEAEDESMQQVLELLKRGEVYNIGPNGEPIHYLPPEGQGKPKSSATAAALGLDSDSKKLPPLSTKTPVSKFKVSRSAAGRSDTPVSETATPVNNLERSSPKVSTPVLTPSVSTPPSIVGSPSFTPPAGIDVALLTGQPPLNPFSMIVDSPSFPAPNMNPSPSTSTSSGAVAAPSPLATANPIAPQVMERKTSRPNRPPTVIASVVREAKPPAASPAQSDQGEGVAPTDPPKKVSRFKMQRMQ